MRIALVGLLGGCQLAFGIDTVAEHIPDAAAPDAPAAGKVVAHYAMEARGTTGACLVDDSGNGHDGSCLGGTPLVNPGQIGNAFTFDGATRIQIPSDGVGGPGPFTVAGWVNYNGAPACPFNRPVGTKGADSWQVCLDPTSVTFYFLGTEALIAPAAPINAWHHYAIAFDGKVAAMYFDATPLGTRDIELSFDTSPLELAADVDMGVANSFLEGALDDVWVFDHALGQGEIQALRGN